MNVDLSSLDKRSKEIFKIIVESFVETGEPVGSRTLSKKLEVSLSPATIRNVMSDLEDLGLLYSPHTSAGRLPTEAGLKLFVHGLMEIGHLNNHERQTIDSRLQGSNQSVEGVLEQATEALSSLTQCAGLVMAPKYESPLRHVEFVYLGPGRALVVLVTEDGMVENRVIELPMDFSASLLAHATNYLSSRMIGKSLRDARNIISEELKNHRDQLDVIAGKIVEAGLGMWAGKEEDRVLIVRGSSHLLNDVQNIDDLQRLRGLFTSLEAKEGVMGLLDATIEGEGVQIFIGSDNNLFSLSGCSVIIAPYSNAKNQMIGAIGVIGPSRINYGKVIPLVDYTAKLITKLMS